MNRTLKLRSALLLVALAVLVGMVLGLALERLAIGNFLRHGMRPPGHGPMIERLQRDLALTPAQRVQVDSIFMAQRGRIERLRGEVERLFAARQDSLDKALAQVLTPQQMDKLHRMIPRRPPGFGRPHEGPRGGEPHRDGPPPRPPDDSGAPAR